MEITLSLLEGVFDDTMCCYSGMIAKPDSNHFARLKVPEQFAATGWLSHLVLEAITGFDIPLKNGRALTLMFTNTYV